MEMSTSLREELTGFLVQGGPMKKVSLFKSMSSAYWVRVIPILRPCLYGRDEVAHPPLPTLLSKDIYRLLDFEHKNFSLHVNIAVVARSD